MFSEEIKREAMLACGRYCSICHKFCGNNMEVHHIKAKADGGQDTFDNAIPLCFDCHAEVRQYDPKHPKGIKFTEKELIGHRDAWYRRVKESTINENRDDTKTDNQEPVRMVHQKDYQNIKLQKVDNGKQLLHFIEGAYGITYDEETETLDEVKLVGEFIQYVKELLDFDDLIDEPYDKVMAGFNLTQNIKELDAAGFWVFTGRENQKLVGGIQKEMIFPVLIMRIVRKDSQEIIKQNLELLKEMFEGTDSK